MQDSRVGTSKPVQVGSPLRGQAGLGVCVLICACIHVCLCLCVCMRALRSRPACLPPAYFQVVGREGSSLPLEDAPPAGKV